MKGLENITDVPEGDDEIDYVQTDQHLKGCSRWIHGCISLIGYIECCSLWRRYLKSVG